MSIMEQFEQSNLCAKSVSPEISYLKSRDILFAGINEDRTHSTITKFVISGSGEISSEKAGMYLIRKGKIYIYIAAAKITQKI